MSLLEFRRIVRANGLAVSEAQFHRFERYVGLLLEWNSRINLISRRDQENIWFSQILHSVSPWFLVDIAPKARVLDLGTGGGMPGIPLAILRPDLSVTLLDSIRKKTDAVRQMVEELGLVNARVEAGRAEEVGREQEHAHAYDIVLARAVAKLSDLVKWSRLWLIEGRGGGMPAGGELSSRVRIDGPALLTLKGGDLEAEIRAAVVRGAKVNAVPLVFPGSEQIGLEEKKLLIVRVR